MSQAIELQEKVFDTAILTKNAPDLVRLVQAWATIQEQKRIIRGRPLPGVLKPELQPNRHTKQRRGPREEGISFSGKTVGAELGAGGPIPPTESSQSAPLPPSASPSSSSPPESSSASSVPDSSPPSISDLEKQPPHTSSQPAGKGDSVEPIVRVKSKAERLEELPLDEDGLPEDLSDDLRKLFKTRDPKP